MSSRLRAAALALLAAPGLCSADVTLTQDGQPLISPEIREVIAINLVLTTILTFNYFDMIWVLTRGGPQNATHIFPTKIYELGFGQFRFGEAAVYGVFSILVLAVMIALTFVVQARARLLVILSELLLDVGERPEGHLRIGRERPDCCATDPHPPKLAHWSRSLADYDGPISRTLATGIQPSAAPQRTWIMPPRRSLVSTAASPSAPLIARRSPLLVSTLARRVSKIARP